VNEGTVKRYRSNLADEIESAITELIQRAEQGLTSLEKKQLQLESKASISARFCSQVLITATQVKVENVKMLSRPAIGTSAVQKLETRKLQTLSRQREKLEAEVQALEKEILELVCLKI
jgi:DASH complex subunit SPC19